GAAGTSADAMFFERVVQETNSLLFDLYSALPAAIPTPLAQSTPGRWDALKAVLDLQPPFSSLPSDYLTLWIDDKKWWQPPDGSDAARRRHIERLRRTVVERRRYVQRLKRTIDVADHLWDIRSFAKLDVLEQRWPDLARRQRSDRDSFLEMERLMSSGAAPTERDWWRDYAKDEGLK